MKEQEPRSAFEIEGFLEGETSIVNKYYPGSQYYICGGVLKVKTTESSCVIIVSSYDPLYCFLKKEWSPVPEPKMYRHEFWDESGELRTVRSNLEWKDFFENTSWVMPGCELIKTEEVGE